MLKIRVYFGAGLGEFEAEIDSLTSTDCPSVVCECRLTRMLTYYSSIQMPALWCWLGSGISFLWVFFTLSTEGLSFTISTHFEKEMVTIDQTVN